MAQIIWYYYVIVFLTIIAPFGLYVAFRVLQGKFLVDILIEHPLIKLVLISFILLIDLVLTKLV